MNYPLTHREYYEGLKEGKLLGLKCRKCGEYTAPPKINCLNCASSDLEVVELSGKGTVRTYSVIRVAPEGHQAPYVVALVELEEGPWVLGNLDYTADALTDSEMIGCSVQAGHRVIAAGNYSAGEGVALVFQRI